MMRAVLCVIEGKNGSNCSQVHVYMKSFIQEKEICNNRISIRDLVFKVIMDFQ